MVGTYKSLGHIPCIRDISVRDPEVQLFVTTPHLNEVIFLLTLYCNLLHRKKLSKIKDPN